MDRSGVAPSRKEVWKMFDAISSTYDAVNRIMTGGLDLYWRRKMAFFLPKHSKIRLLDCATGTADQLLSLLKRSSAISRAVGIDLSQEMLSLGQAKIQAKGLNSKAQLQVASALNIPFEEGSFECISMSFGIRNVTSISLCLQEIYRTLCPGGRVLILETSLPKSKLVRSLHLFYLRKLLPILGGLISRKKSAYRYLNQTTETFPCGQVFCDHLTQAGFVNTRCVPMTFGAVSLYVADKPQ